MSPKLLNILLIIATGTLYYLFINPIYSGIDTGIWSPGEENIKSLIVLRDQYDATIKGIDGISSKANALQKRYDSFDDETKTKMMIMVPDSINTIKLLSELTSIADQAGFPLDSIGVKDRGGEYSVSFTVVTTYTKFKDFITHWEKSMRLFTLQSVTFSPGKTDEDALKFNVDLTTYYLK